MVLLFTTCTSVSAVQENRNPNLGGGKVLLYSTEEKYLDTANVGNLPDMVTFAPNGRTLLSANEEEPSSDYRSDPAGSISIIRLQGSTGGKVQQVTTLTFDGVVIPADFRIKPGISPSLDIEPEYDLFPSETLDGELVYDSGAEFEQELAARYLQSFNTRVDDTNDNMITIKAQVNYDGVTL